MTQKELTKKIIKNAHREAQALITAAENQAQEKIAKARETAAAHREKALEEARAALELQQLQQTKAYEVTQIKAQINAQQALIDQAFHQAQTQLVQADTKTIQKIVAHFTQKYAQPADQIIIARKWSAALPELPTTDAIDAGLIIENSIYRLELSVDAIFNELRAQITPEVARILGVI